MFQMQIHCTCKCEKRNNVHVIDPVGSVRQIGDSKKARVLLTFIRQNCLSYQSKIQLEKKEKIKMYSSPIKLARSSTFNAFPKVQKQSQTSKKIGFLIVW